MTKLHLKYVQSFGGYHYFRRRGSPRVRLPGIVGSTEFMTAYQAALDAAPIAIGAQKRSTPGSVSAAIAALYGSEPSFGWRGAGTKAKYRSILESFRNDYGHLPIGSLPAEFIIALLDKKSLHAARMWLKALRCLCQFAVSHRWMRADPTFGIKIKAPKSDGHHTWTEDEIAQFEAHHPIGSKARLALALGLFTAQRRADVVRIGRQHIRDGVLTVPGQRWPSPCIPTCRRSSPPRLSATSLY
jgi:hypothetical protein